MPNSRHREIQMSSYFLTLSDSIDGFTRLGLMYLNIPVYSSLSHSKDATYLCDDIHVLEDRV